MTMNNAIMPLQNESLRQQLIAREKTLIEKTRTMVRAVLANGGYNTWTHRAVIRQARQRLEALQAGLLPVRLGGPAYHFRTLLNMGDYVPEQIVAKAQEVEERLPGAELRVFGWQRDALPAERRRRDPILAAWYGEAHFFAGFWLEVAMPDEDVPEFFGMTAPILPKAGRGRPRKALQ